MCDSDAQPRSRVVSPTAWQAARNDLLVKEEATRALDALAAERPLLPTVEFDIDYACGITTGFGPSAFLRDGGRVFRSCFAVGRGVDRLRMDFNLLELTALGRQEEWEDSPARRPQSPTYRWARLHDEYPAQHVGGTS